MCLLPGVINVRNENAVSVPLRRREPAKRNEAISAFLLTPNIPFLVMQMLACCWSRRRYRVAPDAAGLSETRSLAGKH